MRSVGRWLALVGAFWLCGSRSSMAQPEDASVVRARELFQRGVEAYDHGVYFDALQAFQAAYQLRPHPAVRVNIANCYEKLDRPAEAIQNFEQFLGSGAGSVQQQQEVVHALEQLRKRVGRLALRVIPDGARIVIDNGEAQPGPLADSVSLSAGRHQVTVALDGHETAMRMVDIYAGDTTELTVSLAPLRAAAAAHEPRPPPTPEPDSPSFATPPPPPPTVVTPTYQTTVLHPAGPRPSVSTPATVWLAGSVTLAALLTSIVTGQLALAADREFNGELAAVRNQQLSSVSRAQAWSDGIDAANRAHTFAVTTDVLLSTAVVGAVLTTVLYLNHMSSVESAQPAVQSSARRLQLRAAF